MSVNDSWDFNATDMSLEASSLLRPVIIRMLTGPTNYQKVPYANREINYHCSLITWLISYTPPPPYPPSLNIWGAVGELPLIMFEIRLYCFHTLEMQRGKRTDSEGACFRNIYYPIKMGASESSNYLWPVSGMMNGTVGLFSPIRIYLWSTGGLHPSTLSEPLPSSD